MDDIELARIRIADTLRLMLAGQLSFIEGSRMVNGWSHNVGFDRLSEPFVTFVAIDSETDAVPTGSVGTNGHRKLWPERAMNGNVPKRGPKNAASQLVAKPWP